MLGGLRTFLIGYHNPTVHSYYVIKAWKKIYKQYPDSRKFICILLHDIGYITQRDSNVPDDKDIHPLIGAKVCGFLFGRHYYNFCIGHSRAYAKRMNVPLSSLCYADKYSVLLISWRVHRVIYFLDSPMVTKDVVLEFRESCKNWWNENGWSV